MPVPATSSAASWSAISTDHPSTHHAPLAVAGTPRARTRARWRALRVRPSDVFYSSLFNLLLFSSNYWFCNCSLHLVQLRLC